MNSGETDLCEISVCEKKKDMKCKILKISRLYEWRAIYR